MGLGALPRGLEDVWSKVELLALDWQRFATDTEAEPVLSVPISVEGCDPGFLWKRHLLGVKGVNLRHIRHLTGVGVWLCGVPGCSDDPLRLHLYDGGAVGAEKVDMALEVCRDLVATVRNRAIYRPSRQARRR